MKKLIFCLIASTPFLSALSQMQVKEYNFSSFRKQEKNTSPILDAVSSPAAKAHPEYGILPYNTQCRECMEVIDKRTIDSRQFVDPYDSGHTWSQTSYFPLHYKNDSNDVWHTIDKRLRPDAANPGVFTAKNQPVPTTLDMNKRNASLDLGELQFSFCNDLTMYFFEDGKAFTQTQKGDYTRYTTGEEGLVVYNMWSGIDMRQAFLAGQVETNYVINAPLNIPVGDEGFMVIEDHFTIPMGYTFEQAEDGPYSKEKYYRGDYVLKNPKGEILMSYEKPIYTDNNSYGMHGDYNLIRNGNIYTLQMMVPVSWLKNPNNVYPIIIDPAIAGTTKLGAFRSSGLPSGNMAFTTYTVSPGYCPYHMLVKVPGRSSLTNTYVDVEWQLTFDNTCQVSPPAPAPECKYTDIFQTLVCDACNTSETITCRQAPPGIYIGTCTTDSVLVPGAHSLLVQSNPPFLGCIPPQCPDYQINFTLKNSDSVCNESCNYLCARGNLWQVTVEACQVFGDITQDVLSVCAGQPITHTAHPECGVPPYHYIWSYVDTSGNTVNTTIYSDSTFVLRPEKTTTVTCTIVDTCGVTAGTNPLTDQVVPAPPADAGPDQKLCAGGTITLGGNPTTDPGATVVWTGSDPTVQAWLSSTTDNNPTVTVPPGTIDTFFYALTATDPHCFRNDTVYVFSGADPIPIIDSSGPTTFCGGQTVTLSVEGGYAAYLWSNGSTGPSINVSAGGSYTLSVKDGNGCPGTSNTIPVTISSIAPFAVFPDTTIQYGDSILLTTNANLSLASIDSFSWYPSVNISCLNCDNPVVSPLSDQYYGLVIFSGGCSLSDSALIKIIYPNNFFIPNGFTPNGDGNDDNFYIQAQSGVHVELFQVFDRWGEKVHDGASPWDGKYHGKDAPEGVYTYVFKLTLFSDSRPLFRKGSVTLLR